MDHISPHTVADPADTNVPSLRVLVVEDDPAALSATVDLLQALGHWATGVGSAEVAKTRFIEGAFDLLMIDVGLPGLSGLDLVDSLPGADAGLRVIFATGQAPPAQQQPGTLWLRKPFSIEQLEAALVQMAPAA